MLSVMPKMKRNQKNLAAGVGARGGRQAGMRAANPAPHGSKTLQAGVWGCGMRHAADPPTHMPRPQSRPSSTLCTCGRRAEGGGRALESRHQGEPVALPRAHERRRRAGGSSCHSTNSQAVCSRVDGSLAHDVWDLDVALGNGHGQRAVHARRMLPVIHIPAAQAGRQAGNGGQVMAGR